MNKTTYHGLECVELSNGNLSLLVTQSVGPRILALRVGESDNLFAELPGVSLDFPGEENYYFYGGHRLWHAPEDPIRTYLPDNQPVTVEAAAGGALVKQATEAETGLQKSMRITLAPDKNRVEVKHVLRNDGIWPVTCAVWAITQFKMGGVALLPQYTGLTNQNITLPNRQITLWPYADITSPYITWGNDLILIHADLETAEQAVKLGYPNPRGWLAYLVEGHLFVKRAEYKPEAHYFDFESSSEVYSNDKFLELETLGPITTIDPGGTANHVETWEIYPDVGAYEDIHDLVGLIDK
jgi:hypothetical protein